MHTQMNIYIFKYAQRIARLVHFVPAYYINAHGFVNIGLIMLFCRDGMRMHAGYGM